METTLRPSRRLNPTVFMFAGPVLVCTGVVVMFVLQQSLARTNPTLFSAIAWFGVPALAAVCIGLTQLGYLTMLSPDENQAHLAGQVVR